MKKSLFYLFALICSASLFTACNDDDEDMGWKQIPSDIPSENVTLDLNGLTVPGATAQLEIKTAETGVLTLKNLLYNRPSVEVNVNVKKVAEGSYDFDGKANLDGATKATAEQDLGLTVLVTGNVTGEKKGDVTSSFYEDAKLEVNVTTSGWGTLSNVYKNDSLVVTVNNESQTSSLPVTLTATSESEVTINFNKIVNVALDVNVPATFTKDGEGYKIEGMTTYKPGYEISVSGTLSSKSVLTLAVTTSGYATINKSYQASSNTITYNGAASKNGNISLNATAEDKVTIGINGMIAGSEGVEIKDAKLSKAADSETYTISGSNKTAGYEVSFEGTVSPERKLTGAVTYKILSSVVGKWSVKMGAQGAESIFKFATASGSVKFPAEIISMLPAELKPYFAETMTDAQVNATVKGLLAKFVPYLQTLEFSEGGEIIASYKEVGKTEVSTLNMLKYYVKDNQIFLVIDIASLMTAGIDSKAWDPGTIFTEGIPLDFTIDGTTLNVSLNEEVTKGILTLASALLPGFAPMFGDKGEMILTIFNTINAIVSESTEFEVGLVLTK